MRWNLAKNVKMSMKTVSVLYIIDRITDDHSSKYLINELTTLGYTISKLIYLNENLNDICNELELSFKQHDIVIVIGGIRNGIIYKTVEKLFSQELQYNEQLVGILNEINEPHDINEISLPLPARLITQCDTYPIVHLQRIFILKETHLIRTFNNILQNHLRIYRNEPIYKKLIDINGFNQELLALEQTSNGIQVDVLESDQIITLSVTSASFSHLINFESRLKTKYGANVVCCRENGGDFEDIYGSENITIKSALNAIEKCLEDYGLENIFLSFNGGKDCTVLLHLLQTVIKKHYPGFRGKVLCLYVRETNPFSEQENFINQCREYYNLDIMTITSGIRDALKETLTKYPNYKACLMGTRRTDPHSNNLNTFQMTDSNWPSIMRVNPLLDWNYSDIWDYLLFYKVPYCKLYDVGYTSIGNVKNTVPNSLLLYYDFVEEKNKYLPAYKLLKSTKEREGRNS